MNIIKKGFTLIELLVVIGILAVLMAGVVALIDPRDKVLQANDTKVISDIGQIASALNAYAAQQSNATYPATATWSTDLGPAGSGELKTVPVPPAATGYGAAYGYSATTTTVANDTAVLYNRLLSKKYTSKCAAGVPYWFWTSTTGKIGGFCGAAAPTAGSTTLVW